MLWDLVLGGADSCQKRFLGEGDLAHHLHLGFAFFLFLEEFSISGHVAAVELGLDVFSIGFDILAGDDLAADGDLNRNLELLAGNGFFEFLGQGEGAGAGLSSKTDNGEGRGLFVIEKDGQFDEIGFLPGKWFVVN